MIKILHLITPSLCFQTLNNLQHSQVNHMSTKCSFGKQIPKSQDDNPYNL